MGNLDKVVQFYTFLHNGTAHRGAVNACVGADFHVVFNHYVAYLWNLFVAFSCGGESEAVGSDDATGVQDAATSHYAVMIDDGIWIHDGVLSHFGAGTDGGVGVQLGSVAYFSPVAHG